MASKDGIDLKVIEGIEFVCEDPPYTKAKPRKFTAKKSSNNETTVGSRLFESGKVIASNHATLSFKGSKVYIIDSGSKHGTWMSSVGGLVTSKSYQLKDGNIIVFGAREDKSDKSPDALRAKIKILRSNSKPEPVLKSILKVAPSKSDSTLDVPNIATPDTLKQPDKTHRRIVDDGKKATSSDGKLDVPNTSKPRSKTPDSLKPPEANSKGHRRTVSLELPSDKDKQQKLPQKSVSTELQREDKIPWSDTFRLGFGVDALTGESMTRTALTSFKMSSSPRPKRVRTYVDTLHWNGIKSFEDQYDVEIGGTVNVAPAAVSMSTRISSVLAKNASASTILIQYRVIGEFETEFIPANVTMQDGLGDLREGEFRQRYGDYYLAGRQRGYGCRMVIVCRVDDKVTTDTLEVEAQMLVENFFKAGGGQSKSKMRSKNCSILHVMIETYGCSADASYLSNGLLSPQDALAALPKILTNPKGTPRIAILYHYSSLPNCTLPRTITVHRDVFTKIHEMRDIYLDLQTYLEHPALQSGSNVRDVERVRSAINAFTKERKNLVRNLKIDRQPKRLQDTQIYAQMAEAKLKADGLMKRYEFISGVKTMPRDWRRSGTKLKDKQTFLWECGKFGGRMKKRIGQYTQVVLGAGFEAYEAEWESPLTTAPNPLKKMMGRSGSPEHMGFIRFDPDENGGRRGRIPEEGEEAANGFFNFQLAGGKVYVVGWMLSCTWDGKPEPGPVIQLDDGENNFILSDRFSVRLDTSCPARWHCKVTFVFQTHHNFPDLKLEQRNFKESDIDTEI